MNVIVKRVFSSLWVCYASNIYSVMFRPCGAEHLRHWIQSFSSFSLRFSALSLCFGRGMNSRTCMLKSLVPLWLCCAKLALIVSPRIQVLFPMLPCQVVMVRCFHDIGSGAIMSLETFNYGTFRLSHILLLASSAGDCIDQITAFASEIPFHFVCLACDRAG